MARCISLTSYRYISGVTDFEQNYRFAGSTCAYFWPKEKWPPKVVTKILFYFLLIRFLFRKESSEEVLTN